MAAVDDLHFQHGVELFNAGRFFAAHEALEDAWREAAGEERLFLQGLVQAAVGLHHASVGNRAGACSVLARARRNLSGYPARYAGIDLEGLRRQLADFDKGLREGTPLPEMPRMNPG